MRPDQKDGKQLGRRLKEVYPELKRLRKLHPETTQPSERLYTKLNRALTTVFDTQGLHLENLDSSETVSTSQRAVAMNVDSYSDEGNQQPSSTPHLQQSGSVKRDSQWVMDHGNRKLYGLDARLFLQREATRDKVWERAILRWVQAVTCVELDLDDIVSSLKSGVILCVLINKLKPRSVCTYSTSRLNVLMERQNLQSFLQACHTLGVAEHNLFTTGDLQHGRDIGHVFTCLYHLNLLARSKRWTKTVIKPRIPVTKSGGATALRMLNNAEPRRKSKSQSSTRNSTNSSLEVLTSLHYEESAQDDEDANTYACTVDPCHVSCVIS